MEGVAVGKFIVFINLLVIVGVGVTDTVFVGVIFDVDVSVFEGVPAGVSVDINVALIKLDLVDVGVSENVFVVLAVRLAVVDGVCVLVADLETHVL